MQKGLGKPERLFTRDRDAALTAKIERPVDKINDVTRRVAFAAIRLSERIAELNRSPGLVSRSARIPRMAEVGARS